MSRIGKMPVAVPQGVTVTVADNNFVTVKGPKGQLEQQMPAAIKMEEKDGNINVTRPSDVKEHRALHGLTRALLFNMVTGVTQGYTKNLDIVGVGYRAQKQGSKIVLNVGYSHTVEFDEPKGVSLEVPSPNRIVVSGIDKQLVGETAAKIRIVRKPEPYQGTGIRYEGEYVRRKEGKAGKKS